jgi:hypothetical protein
MNMVRLIYVSRLSEECGPKELEDILATSRKNNEPHGITGALCYSPQAFLQCLEGPRDTINRLYGAIVRDDRHNDVTLLHYADIHQREFESWTMAYIRADDLDKRILFKYSPTKTLDPFQMTAAQALGFIRELSKAHRQVSQEAVTVGAEG